MVVYKNPVQSRIAIYISVFLLVWLNQGGSPCLSFSNCGFSLWFFLEFELMVFPYGIVFCCGVQFLWKLGPQASSCTLVYTAEQ